MAESGRVMAAAEGRPFDEIKGRTMAAQAHLMYSLVYRKPYPDPLFASFQPFTGVFPYDPWKPDQRQSAQQALFLCVADPAMSFFENLNSHALPGHVVVHRFVLPASLRQEALDHLASMNVTAATLFP